MKTHRILLYALVVALLCVAYGCASEGISKTEATQATGIAGVFTWLAAPITGGWSILVGFAAGLLRLFFATSTSTAAPGATGAVVQQGLPIWLVFALILAWVKRNRIWQILTGGTDGRWNALLRLLGFKTKPPPQNLIKRGVA
jgi:hypothetical protein